MASITVKNIPEDLHRRLKEIAKQGGRSLNQEIVQQLRAAIAAIPTSSEVEAEIAALRRHHKQRLQHGYTPPSPEEIVRIIREGRESR